MAYVGTAQNLGNDQDTLRSVVLGEAGNQGLAGQQAVADVIYNRANAGTFPGGSDPIAVATAPHQFQGQVNLSNYSPSQIATADQAIANAQSGQDLTGGATYYANPSASTASWATNLNSSNSLKIGDHYFTDNTNGVPFTGTGAATTPSAAAAPATDASGGYTLSNPYPQYDSSGNLITNPTATVQDAGQNGTATAPTTSGSNPSGDVLNPSAVPIAITTTGKLAADTATADTKTATSTATTIYGSIFTGLADSFGRVAFFVIGLILLAGGLWIIASEESGGAVPGPAETFRRGKTLFA